MQTLDYHGFEKCGYYGGLWHYSVRDDIEQARKYYFDEDDPLLDVYEREPSLGLHDEEEIRLLRNRSVNAANFVDRNIGRLLDALERRGLAQETVVIVVGDHGEAFEQGYLGHATFHPDVLAIPIILSLPGVEARTIDALVGSSTVMATLLDYLDIPGLSPWMLWGRSLLTTESPADGVLTANGDQSRFLLTLPEGAVEFRSTSLPAGDGLTTLHFVVQNAWDREGNAVDELRPFLERLEWRSALERHLTRPKPPL